MKLIDKFKHDPKLFMIMALGNMLPNTVMCNTFYLKLLYKQKMKKKLNLKQPRTYNEKLQWLKIYNHCSEYTMMVDKHGVKEYVASIIGNEYIIPTIGVWDNFDDIKFDELPNQFVLKCTHDSGGLVICKDKSKLNIGEVRKKIERCLKRNYFLNTREWPYKNVKARIIAEEYIIDESVNELKDYKFFTFDGTVKAMFIATDRDAETETCFDFFDRDFNHLPFCNGHPNAGKYFEKPKNYEKMIELAEALGKGLVHARIDFYNIRGHIYFGEITFYHWSGMKPFEPEEWDYKFGEWINLPK